MQEISCADIFKRTYTELTEPPGIPLIRELREKKNALSAQLDNEGCWIRYRRSLLPDNVTYSELIISDSSDPPVAAKDAKSFTYLKLYCYQPHGEKPRIIISGPHVKHGLTPQADLNSISLICAEVKRRVDQLLLPPS